MSRHRDLETGRFVSGGLQPWQVFMETHDCVREWLKTRPEGTQKQYGRRLLNFVEQTGVSPEEFLELDRFEARDLTWKYVKPFIVESTSKAKNNLDALKSFYRSKDGETLPFDSRRGGKHYFNKKRRVKAAMEHVPNKPEMYRIIEAATNIRDKTMLLVLFQSGIRENALYHLRFKHVKDGLYPEPKIPLRLRITDRIDTKLRGYSIDFYDTFLQGEAVQELRAYCDKYHTDRDDEKPLFYTRLGNPLNGERVWDVVKGCVKRAGLNPKNIWVHTIRKAFKRVVRHTSLDDEFKEAIMGHVLEGSRENYFSRNEPEEIAQEYMKIDFSRQIPESKAQRQAEEIERLQKEVKALRESELKWEESIRKLGILEAVVARVQKYIDEKLEDPRYAERALKESERNG